MGGGTLTVTGAAGEANSQTFNGLNITGGNNRSARRPAAGGSITLNLGAINRTGGLVNFDLPTGGSITTTNTDARRLGHGQQAPTTPRSSAATSSPSPRPTTP